MSWHSTTGPPYNGSEYGQLQFPGHVCCRRGAGDRPAAGKDQDILCGVRPAFGSGFDLDYPYTISSVRRTVLHLHDHDGGRPTGYHD